MPFLLLLICVVARQYLLGGLLADVGFFVYLYCDDVDRYFLARLWLDWRDKVNSDPTSFSPSTNNESITGILIIITTAITCSLWGIFFYWFLLV